MRLLAKYILILFLQVSISIILLFGGSIDCAANQADSKNPPDSSAVPFAFKIADVRRGDLGSQVSLPVLKLRGSEEIYGFDFLLAYDANVLSFQGIDSSKEIFGIPGEYEWEYFTYRHIPWKGDSSLPSGMLRIVALADQSGDSHLPKKYAVKDSTTLFTVRFVFTYDRNAWSQFIPVRFFWTDCGDNTVAFRFQSDSLYDIKTAISRTVFDQAYIKISDTASRFPTFYGTPNSCSKKGPQGAIRWIDYRDGGVGPLHSDPDPVGDININGLSFEAADESLFYNYFTKGIGVFTISEDGQKAASDVNNDGNPLTVQDYRQLQIRKGGDYISNDTIDCQLKIESQDSILKINFAPDSTASAIWLWFLSPKGSIESPAWAASSQTGDTVKIFAPIINQNLPAGPLELKYQGTAPSLIYYEAAGPHGEFIKFDIVRQILLKSPISHPLYIAHFLTISHTY